MSHLRRQPQQLADRQAVSATMLVALAVGVAAAALVMAAISQMI
ncbi:MAG TPA: hypothetical protein VFB80_15255 [Pirellulaceae bacterium]|nr:hypothetical protein [Pirellulaceae bacterium]